jgi:hypothetical protein
MRRRGHRRIAAGCGLALGVLGFVDPAMAKSHLWKFKEIFSNADGSVQYIEMDVLDPAGTGEWVTIQQQLATRDHVYIIPVNLPNENTFQRSMLFATPAFAALPGAPTPDFLIPAGFMDPSGDELRYRFTLDLFAYTDGELPIDGRHALVRSDRSRPLNSPENFAGATTSIDVGAAVSGVWPPLLVVALLLGVRLEAALRRRRSPATR